MTARELRTRYGLSFLNGAFVATLGIFFGLYLASLHQQTATNEEQVCQLIKGLQADERNELFLIRRLQEDRK